MTLSSRSTQLSDYDLLYGLNRNQDQNAWFDEGIRRRNATSRNAIIGVVGDPRSGKSALACQIALRNDRTFTNQRVLYNPNVYFDLEPTMPNPSWLMFDEAGVSLDSHDWQTAVSKALRHNIEMFGFKIINIEVVSCTLGLVEKTHRTLVQFVIELLDRGRAVVWRIYSDHFYSTYKIPCGTLENYEMPNTNFWTEYSKNKEQAYHDMLEGEKKRMARAREKGQMPSVFQKEPIITLEDIPTGSMPKNAILNDPSTIYKDINTVNKAPVKLRKKSTLGFELE